MKKVYAITGGIGSGKSMVTTIIKSLGYAVFSADEVYANLLKNSDFCKQIYNLLDLKFNSEKGFDRKEVANVVFADKQKLKLLNSFTHDKIMATLNDLSININGVVFHEVPLLFESGYQDRYDGVIVVYRNLEDRINAVISRDNLTKTEVESRIKNQFDYENNSLLDYIIIKNDGEYEDLKSNVKEVLLKLNKN